MSSRVFVAVISLMTAACASSSKQLKWQRLDLTNEPGRQMLLTGAPQTAGMRSGRVILQPGEEMHRHSTNGNEEVLLFLAGRARVVVGTESVDVGEGQVLYIPPQTEHEVHNEGPQLVRYVFTVAPAR